MTSVTSKDASGRGLESILAWSLVPVSPYHFKKAFQCHQCRGSRCICPSVCDLISWCGSPTQCTSSVERCQGESQAGAPQSALARCARRSSGESSDSDPSQAQCSQPTRPRQRLKKRATSPPATIPDGPGAQDGPNARPLE